MKIIKERSGISIHFKTPEVEMCEAAIKTALRRCSETEIKAIIAALQNGDINGCVSRGPRCCLIGTLARLRNSTMEECRAQLALAPEIVREIEYWFFQICSPTEETKQNTENNHFALFAFLWCEQILSERTHQTERTEAAQQKKYTMRFEGLLKRVLDSEKTWHALRLFFQNNS